MIHIGLTGGIGSGKTTVARVLRIFGVPVFDADAMGRHLLNENELVRHAVQERFGGHLFQGGTLDRKALASVVFGDREALAALNAIVHPAVREQFGRWAAEQHASYVVLEAAILVDTGGDEAFDRLVLVSAPEELRISRVMERDGVDEKTVRARMANQVTEAVRLSKAHHVILNDDRHLVIPQVLAVHDQLTRLGDQ